MIRLAVVGAGIIGKTHISAINESNECSLVAISEINEEVAKELGSKQGVPYYLDYREMAEKEKIDAVIINLPHFLHCEATVFFLDKGINVLCEKPMANSLEECDKMIAASKKNGAKLAVGHIQRFFGANEIVKKFVDNKALGELCMTNEMRNVFYFDEKRPRWFLNKQMSGGGIVMNYGAHALDKLFYIIGGEVSDITAVIGNNLNDFDIEGHAQIKLTMGGKISSCMTFCGYTTFNVNETIYYFTKGALRVSHSNNLEICRENNGEFVTYEFSEDMKPFNKQLHEFIKFVNGGESRIATAEYSRKIIDTITKIYSC